MNKSLLYQQFIFLFLSINTIFAQSPIDSGFVWLIRGENNSIYLAGSLHLLHENNYPLPAVFNSAYAESEVIVFEIHPDSLQTPDAQRRLMSIARYPEGENLMQSLQDTVLYRFQEICRSLSLNPHQLYPYKPWFVSVSLTTVQLNQLGFRSQLGVDLYFFNKAKNDGKKIEGLESLNDQLRLFSDLPDSRQEELLQQTFGQLHTIKTEMDSIISAWYSADLYKLDRAFAKNFFDYPDLAERLVSQRNMAWVDRILVYSDRKEDYMVIVGSGHFPGKNGLLQLLENKGLKPVRLLHHKSNFR